MKKSPVLINYKDHSTEPRNQWIYIGRKHPAFESESLLANPFIIGKDGDRKTVLTKYREWLFDRLANKDYAIWAGLLAIKETDTLVCFCSPEPCHGDIILKAWHWIIETHETEMLSYWITRKAYFQSLADAKNYDPVWTPYLENAATIAERHGDALIGIIDLVHQEKFGGS